MRETAAIPIAPNWTSLAGAVEAILGHLGTPLPRHAVMGLSGLAWHLCVGTKGGVTALPSGPTDIDRRWLLEGLARTGWRWERYAASAKTSDAKEAAIEWICRRLDPGTPVIGWDLRLHEYAVVHAFDEARQAFVVSDVLSDEGAGLAPVADWARLGEIELIAPLERDERDALQAIAAALQSAIDCFAGRDGPQDGQPRGTAAFEAWAAALESDNEVDRAGHAYTLAVLQAARLDGALFLGDVAAALPELHESLERAATALRDEAQALAPLITLFPFPAMGHGNITNAGLRRAAAGPLRRAGRSEQAAGEQVRVALDLLQQELAAGT